METHENMVDGICLWSWLVPKLQSLITAEYMAKLEDMFHRGKLGSYYFKVVEFEIIKNEKLWKSEIEIWEMVEIQQKAVTLRNRTWGPRS